MATALASFCSMHFSVQSRSLRSPLAQNVDICPFQPKVESTTMGSVLTMLVPTENKSQEK